jgi:hypothetical protein
MIAATIRTAEESKRAAIVFRNQNLQTRKQETKKRTQTSL